MREKLTMVKVDDKEFPLLYNGSVFLDFEDRYGAGVSLDELFNGPKIYDTDTDEEKSQKEEAIKKAKATMKRETPWIVSVMAKWGCLMLEEEGKTIEPPTEQWIALHWKYRQIPTIMSAVFLAITRGVRTEHKKDEDKEVDVVLEELESKNA